jgi:UDP-3-O-[3-hydroxymyristoyl] glucosamine N-acyltransferase
MLGGQVGIADHVTVGDGAMVAAQSGVAGDLAAGEKVMGTPALPHTQRKRIVLAERHLPDMARRLRRLEQRLEALAARLGDVSPREETGDDA